MDRPSVRGKYLAAALALTMASLLTAGCRGFLPAMVYFIKGSDIDPVCDKMAGKKVAVVCQPQVQLTYKNGHVAREIARQTEILLRRVPDIVVIDQQDVDQWNDQITGEEVDFAQLAEQTGADMVLAIDLLEFDLYAGATLYQGTATVSFTLYDCTDGQQSVFQRELSQIKYPPNGGVDTSSKPESEFRRGFTRKVADEIGRHFYAHDHFADYALEGEAE